MKMRALVIAIMLAVILAISASAQQYHYNMLELDRIEGYSSIQVYRINNQNQILATGYSNGSRYLLALDTDKKVITASALDSSIATIGHCSDSGFLTGKTTTGNIYSWSAQTGLREFDILSASEYAQAASVNNSGQVLFYNRVGDYATSYVWNSSDNSLTTIEQSNDWLSCIGTAINNSGKVVGYTEFYAGVTDYWHKAFTWDSAHGFSELSGQYSMAWGVNDNGDVCGFSSDSLGYDNAAIWDTTGARTSLSKPHYINNSYATVINNTGQTAGNISYYSQEPNCAYLWENGNWNDLYDLSGGAYSWGIYDSLDINDSGLVLAAAIHNGVQTQVVLIPVPEPSTIIPLVLGLCGVCRIVTRRRVRE